ncbi:hypothetical protein Tco_1052384, partial [Tanacetum coccineum]
MSAATTIIQATLLLRSPATTAVHIRRRNAFAFEHRESSGHRCFASKSNSNDGDTSQ